MLDLLADRLIDQSGFIERANIDPKTARHWERRNFGPLPVRIGRAVLYDLREVERFVEARSAA